ncbi:ketodeoxygluconokinase [Enterobacterales bacterium CwR94]|nr:ketodeoxygluconokinase [Enterobacterales bacterium CwR94]
MQQNIAIIGECMIELSGQQDQLRRGFGGDTLNTAVYLARQTASTPLAVSYVTAMGDDAYSQQMIDQWAQEGVDTYLIQRFSDKLPGLYVIETDAQGERTFAYWRNDAAARYWLERESAEAVCEALARFDYVYLSGISLAILPPASREKLMALLQRVRANGGKVLFDNNYRPRLWHDKAQTQDAYRAMLSCTDIAFLTLDDETLLWGEASVETVIARTHAAGVAEVVIKRGADSCLVSANNQQVEVPAQRLRAEQVVDTTAAGDAFSAGYLAKRLLGGSPKASAEQGHLIASHVIQHRGAIIPPEAMP